MSKLAEIYHHLLPSSPKEETDRVAKQCENFFRYLRHKNDILFLTTSNRYIEHKDDIPKSTQLARKIKAHYKNKRITIIDVPPLMIHACEGNISTKNGNRCGLPEAQLKDKKKN